MRSSLAAVLAPAVAAAQDAGGAGDAGRLPYLWVWILASAVLLAVLAYLLFGPSARQRTRAHSAHRARREVHGD